MVCRRSNICFLDKESGEIVRGRCKAYHCPDCGNGKVQKLRRAMKDELKKWKQIRFWTFTLNHRVADIETHRRIMQKAWTILTREIRRSKGLGKTQREFSFIRVWERCKDGYYHFHVFIDCYIHRDFLHRVWLTALRMASKANGCNVDSFGDTCIGSSFVEGKTHFTPEIGANYVTKYITKSIQDSEDYSKRRYSKSHEIVFWRKKVAVGHWIAVKMTTADFLTDFVPIGTLPEPTFLSGCTIAHENSTHEPPERPPTRLTNSEMIKSDNLADAIACAERKMQRNKPIELFDTQRNGLLD